MIRTRFAPSPTGPLHLGHAYAAWVAWSRGDEMLLRIEDLDQSRARPAWETAIFEDLAWLGLTYPRPVLRQSSRSAAYGAALDRLWEMGLLYPCSCTRRDIAQAATAPQEGAPAIGPDGVIYPGTCRHRSARRGPRPSQGALRLDLTLISSHNILKNITYSEKSSPISIPLTDLISDIGDVVVSRADGAAAYHLAVVVDDAAQGITEVTRGADLAEATPIHVLLQRLLDLPTPRYFHHGLIRDPNGKRLAKRDDARALRLFREAGWTPEALLAHVRALTDEKSS